MGRPASRAIRRTVGVTPPSQVAYRYYLPLMIGSPPPLEFWLVAQEAASGDCYLYRSRDDGAPWDEIAVP